jgi:hypothetical protein
LQSTVSFVSAAAGKSCYVMSCKVSFLAATALQMKGR